MPESAEQRHYLEEELHQLVREDGSIFEFLQAGSLDGLWYWDLEDPAHEWMSPRFWEVLGFDPKARQHLSAEWQDLIDPEDLLTATANFQQHLEDPTCPYNQMVRYRHAEGHTVWIRCRGIAIRDAEGKPIRMLGAHTDMTETKRSEHLLKTQREELEQANADLQKMNADLQIFARLTSHDLKAPARQIAALVRFIQEDHADSLPEEAASDLQEIGKIAHRMHGLVDSVLAVCRTGWSDLGRETILVRKLIEQSLQAVAGNARSAQVECKTEGVPADLNAYGDPVLLGEALQNLLENAITHGSQAGGRVVVSAHLFQDQARLIVQDDGPGVSQERIDSLSRAFGGIVGLGTRSGTGHGLPIVKLIAERHGGQLSIESSAETGAKMVLDLPLGRTR